MLMGPFTSAARTVSMRSIRVAERPNGYSRQVAEVRCFISLLRPSALMELFISAELILMVQPLPFTPLIQAPGRSNGLSVRQIGFLLPTFSPHLLLQPMERFI